MLIKEVGDFRKVFIDSMNIQSSGNFHCELFTVMALKLRLLVNKLGNNKVSFCYPEYYAFLIDVIQCIIVVQTFYFVERSVTISNGVRVDPKQYQSKDNDFM
ncbi:hypothetical protein EIN_443740 [Entamoeba invadens IP1]|uniref:Uncharacterized protein n=1 Tax=Entamoeba invadens IP1 TaxID=370355 RepID=A0A0A1UG66_ENTIV|nr:hypothetical protein EIN_443740 [Entamoeba invadens IP1]ELP92384.1 hypothetical protein EIN_443740 [Entamoeba invadens IP1]|eukprot:XP_004259155.1 hypothetical protein EIN_443740 [Entamoeba invadens IP1]